MKPVRFIFNSLVHYRKRNVLLALGFAISTAVLTGALIVGDSVDYSLKRIVEQRLGNVTLIMRSGDRYFTGDLAGKIQQASGNPVSAVLLSDGMAVASGGALRLNQVTVAGVDSAFDAMAGQQDLYSSLQGDTVIISQNLARRLNLAAGDEFLLRMTRASLVPMNAPFVSDQGNQVSLRVVVSHIAGASELGTFNIRNSQSAPFNIFISGSRLRELMELGDHANLLLMEGGNLNSERLKELVQQNWSARDAGLRSVYNGSENILDVKSDRVFIDDPVAEGIKESGAKGEACLTYFVNSIRLGMHTTPYSFMSGMESLDMKEDEIILNRWLAEDLKANVNDTLSINYFTVGPLRALDTATAKFIVSGIFEMDSLRLDRDLMPDIPGLSDAGNCRDWEAGVPITLDSIRDKDEKYWTVYKGTPKAYISLDKARELWGNRFGSYTSFRFRTSDPDGTIALILARMDPRSLGFQFIDARSGGEYAAANGVDFSGLFGGLSFFLLAAGIILAVLLFKLNLEERKEQITTLTALGIPVKQIRRLLIIENMFVALVGALVGLGLAVLYNRGVFYALNTIWSDIVRTTMLEVHLSSMTLLTGFLASLLVALLVVVLGLNSFLRKTRGIHRKADRFRITILVEKLILLSGGLFISLALLLVLIQLFKGITVNPAVFFPAGGLFLAGGILLAYGYLTGAGKQISLVMKPAILTRKSMLGNLSRSMSIIILLALGSFIVISTGSNRKDLFRNANQASSGTGGFLYYAESTIPVLKSLNDRQVRYDLGIDVPVSFSQLRISEGDDASCLNLNLIRNPRILGVDADELNGRFTFVTKTDELDAEYPWLSLKDSLPGNLVPAIADETVIKWGLGMNVGDTLEYQDGLGNTMKLLLIGGLSPSIFQGSVLIDNSYFLEHFPSSSGTEVFLINGAASDSTRIRDELFVALRNLGWTMELSAVRLVRFSSVTNTYLAIFLVLGAIGLLLGTVGLAIILSRSVMERKQELSLLMAVGLGMKRIRRIIRLEYLFLLTSGTLIGSVSAILATLPSFLNRNSDVSITLVLIIVVLLLLNGLFWIDLVTRMVLKKKIIGDGLRQE